MKDGSECHLSQVKGLKLFYMYSPFHKVALQLIQTVELPRPSFFIYNYSEIGKIYTTEELGLCCMKVTKSHFFYYGKSWNEKKYLFSNGEIYLIWIFLSRLDTLRQFLSLSFDKTFSHLHLDTSSHFNFCHDIVQVFVLLTESTTTLLRCPR